MRSHPHSDKPQNDSTCRAHPKAAALLLRYPPWGKGPFHDIRKTRGTCTDQTTVRFVTGQILQPLQEFSAAVQAPIHKALFLPPGTAPDRKRFFVKPRHPRFHAVFPCMETAFAYPPNTRTCGGAGKSRAEAPQS